MTHHNKLTVRCAGVTPPLLGVLLQIGLSGCASDTSVGPVGYTARDSAGIRIVENTLPMWPPDSGWTVAATPTVDLGGDTGDTSHYLYNVVAVERLSKGDLVVANAGSRQLLMFDRSGGFVGATGGPGGGPGEFLSMYGLFRCAADTLVVDELRRWSLWESVGRFVRTSRVDRGEGDGFLGIEGVSTDCSALLMLSRQMGTPAVDGFNQPHTLYWAGTEGDGRDTVVTFSGPERRMISVSAGVGGPPVPFGASPVWAVAGEQVYLGRSTQFSYEIFDRTGTLRTIVRWSAERQQVTKADRDRLAERSAALIREAPQEAEILEQVLAFPLPTLKPTYAGILVDDEGNVWVRPYPPSVAGLPQAFQAPDADAAPEIWWVFDATGRWLGPVHVPAGLAVHAISLTHLVGISRDQDDVEHVLVYEVNQPSPN